MRPFRSSLLLVTLTVLPLSGRPGVVLKPPSAGKAEPTQVRLEDAKPLLGKWILEAVAPSLRGAKIPENREWEFRPDGKIVTRGWNRHFRRYDRQEFPYRVEDGKIITQIPGRKSGLVYEIYELKGDSMILKGGMEGYYFFKRKP